MAVNPDLRWLAATSAVILVASVMALDLTTRPTPDERRQAQGRACSLFAATIFGGPDLAASLLTTGPTWTEPDEPALLTSDVIAAAGPEFADPLRDIIEVGSAIAQQDDGEATTEQGERYYAALRDLGTACDAAGLLGD